MKIINKGRGIHQREVAGIERLKRDLPETWIGFTNLEMALPRGAREIDLIIIAEDRLLVVDLKDWNGSIESAGNGWRLNGRFMDGGNPVDKICENRRELSIKLASFLKQARRPASIPENLVPKVEPCVVLTATADRKGIAETEKDKVFPLEFFISMLCNTPVRIKTLGGAAPAIFETRLTGPDWLPLLQKFFSIDESYFRASSRTYGTYKAESDNHSFLHSKNIFSEYDASDPGSDNSMGLLRRWDFTNADARFMTEAGRMEIAGRERKVIAWLCDHNADFESGVLQPRAYDDQSSVNYWEVFERRRRLRRLSEIPIEQLISESRETRLQLLRQVLLRVKQMHDINAAHLDLGPHSVWLEVPSIARLSHLMAARHPDRASLGEKRFQFLSSVSLPEDICDAPDTAQRKDVFLLGGIAHYILLGKPAVAAVEGEPPEWDASLDRDGSMIHLHDWLARALQWDPQQRFRDAGEMLDELNRLLTEQPSTQYVVKALESFRTISSQMRLWREFPVEKEICDDDRVTIWTSEMEGEPVVVKLWKSTAWSNLEKEGERLLAFLEYAEMLRQDHPPGCAVIRRAIWIGDALVLVQQYVEAPTLATILASEPALLGERASILAFLRTLCVTVNTLHERQIAHGDLKPENILVQTRKAMEDGEENGPQPVIIDLLDFSPTDDGERVSTAYAPATGGRFERDCFAVTRIAEEILMAVPLEPQDMARLQRAVDHIRTTTPENATLLPLIESIDACVETVPTEPRHRITLVIPNDEGAPFYSDEGNIAFILRKTSRGAILCMRGATEEIILPLDERFRRISAQREPAKLTSARDRHDTFATLPLDIVIEPGVAYDLDDLTDLLVSDTLAANWLHATIALQEIPAPLVKAPVVKPSAPETADPVDATDAANDDGEDGGEEDEQGEDEGLKMEPAPVTIEDRAIEIVPAEPVVDIDVPRLWGLLMKSEEELIVYGTATADSYYSEQTRHHHVEFQWESGAFDFSRDDTVTIKVVMNNDVKRHVGILDIVNSRPSQLRINNAYTSQNAIIQAGQQLLFTSQMGTSSLEKRRAATQRILTRKSRIRNLIDILNPRRSVRSVVHPHAVDQAALMRDYSLNDSQARAFAQVIGHRPLGLLQGPPGTGKTKFIAALVHYALSNGLAKNVLLASQSHEAVNGATEAVLRLFSKEDRMPSVLRVGNEGVVSEQLLPYHLSRVEQLLKDRFKAELRTRLQVAGKALALPDAVVEKLIVVETVIRPIVERLLQFQDRADETGMSARIDELRATLRTLIEPVHPGRDLDRPIDLEYLSVLGNWIASESGFMNASRVQKFRDVAALARDFITSVSSRERSLESFLAGTRRIVAGTCVGLGRASLGLTATPFDLVIVDEAARCNPGELAVPLQSGRWVVLVGDHRQLVPQQSAEVVAQVGKELGLGRADVLRSDFERVFGSNYGGNGGASLSQQYRMLPPIGEIVSKVFYGGMLTHGRDAPMIEVPKLPLALEKPLTWIATDEFGPEGFQRLPDHERPTLVNPTEADLIVALVKRWDTDPEFRNWIGSQEDQFPKAIGIICTYSGQSKLIRDRLNQAALSDVMKRTIKVDTVDSYQGKENPIVILSLTRNNNDGVEEDLTSTISEGFMREPNRLNVAVSRAMDRLIMVGASRRWRRDSPMGRISDEFVQQIAKGHAEMIDGVRMKLQLMSVESTNVALPVALGESQ
ncbi:TPA: NERD domain-containing protein [Burkholderia vietnamiensis]|uniref:AAA domain-containing protein n=1 Tax=Burkholderia vietnamiensis TaxID=60552 RepID=UPI002655B0AA|nr:AAA domain-containing protein [Burkholderia vietnamiensis]MDN8115251.1 AAA domain-containing protein [Burkholderia vietnamiensis]HDR9140008.1 NERD domain-containing protein [Burkholderia vietnamiensis]